MIITQEPISVGQVTGLHVSEIKGFFRRSEAYVSYDQRGFKHSRCAVPIRWKGDTPIFLSSRDVPELVLLDAEISYEQGEVRIRHISEAGWRTFKIEKSKDPIEVRVFKSVGEGYDLGNEVSKFITQFVNSMRLNPEDHIQEIRLIGPQGMLSWRQMDDKYLPEDVGVPSYIQWQDGMAFTLLSVEELFALNQYLISQGLNLTTMQHWRMDFAVSLPGVDIQRIKDVRIGDQLFRNVRPCERCKGMNTDILAGKHFPEGQGPFDVLKHDDSPFRGGKRMEGLQSEQFVKYHDRKSGVPLVGINLAPHLPETGGGSAIEGFFVVGNKVEVLSLWD